jgi:hypothetical protein
MFRRRCRPPPHRPVAPPRATHGVRPDSPRTAGQPFPRACRARGRGPAGCDGLRVNERAPSPRAATLLRVAIFPQERAPHCDPARRPTASESPACDSIRCADCARSSASTGGRPPPRNRRSPKNPNPPPAPAIHVLSILHHALLAMDGYASGAPATLGTAFGRFTRAFSSEAAALEVPLLWCFSV